MKRKPIIILGFGRSGTTWVSDIISKSLGSLLLFEPFHPAVWDQSGKLCYAANNHDDFKSQISFVLNKKERNPWLIRNHLSVNPQQLNQSYIDSIWENCEISGFKAIRANHQIPYLYQEISDRILFTIRHPLAVIASIKNRPRFFEELGWQQHQSLFEEHVLQHPLIKRNYKGNFNQLETFEEKVATMWALSHLLSLTDLINHNLPIIFYEDLYLKPFEETKKILKVLGSNHNIHPSYLFTPSMLTLKTAHSFSQVDDDFFKFRSKVFWKDNLTDHQANQLMHLIESIIKPHSRVYHLIKRYFES